MYLNFAIIYSKTVFFFFNFQAYDWWLDDMYLNNPIALPINSNPGMVWPTRNLPTTIDMVRFATRMISAALQYKRKLDRYENLFHKAII